MLSIHLKKKRRPRYSTSNSKDLAVNISYDSSNP